MQTGKPCWLRKWSFKWMTFSSASPARAVASFCPETLQTRNMGWTALNPKLYTLKARDEPKREYPGYHAPSFRLQQAVETVFAMRGRRAKHPCGSAV